VNPHDDGADPHGEDVTGPADPAPDSEPDVEGPAGFDAWRRRSAVGEAGTAIARGLGAVFAPSENRPVVTAPVPGDPPDPARGFRVVLDPDDPTKAVAVFDAKTEAEGEPPPDSAVPG